MKEYTDEMMENLSICKCHKLIHRETDKLCPGCLSNNDACQAIKKDDTRCNHKVGKKDSRFCGRHDKGKHYTREEIERMQLKFCSNHKYYAEIPDGYTTCLSCRDRAENLRKKAKEDSDVQICNGITKNKKKCTSAAQLDSNFCGKHTEYARFWNTGLTKCSVYFCFEVVNDPEQHKRCEKCRERDNNNERARRAIHREKVEKAKSENIHLCSVDKCGKQFEPYEMPSGLVPTKCKECYEAAKEVEKNRPQRRRNWKQEMLNNPGRAEKRRQRIQNIKLNKPEVLWKYWIEHRLRKREKMGNEAYLKEQRERMAMYRKEHPELIKRISSKHLNTLQGKLQMYKYTAEIKNTKWSLTDEEAFIMFISPCFYCGMKEKDRLNGIDKIVYNYDYVKENCVPCCKGCNIMKGCMDVDVFIARCMHIISFNGMVEDEQKMFFPQSSYDSGGGLSFQRAKDSAKKRNIGFELTKEEFNEIVQRSCYLCGKENSLYHQNGIDRINSELSYNGGNCESCCASCNYMKNVQLLDNFLERCYLVGTMHKAIIDGESFDIKGDRSIKHHIDKDIKKSVIESRNVRNNGDKQNFDSLTFAEKSELKVKKSVERRNRTVTDTTTVKSVMPTQQEVLDSNMSKVQEFLKTKFPSKENVIESAAINIREFDPEITVETEGTVEESFIGDGEIEEEIEEEQIEEEQIEEEIEKQFREIEDIDSCNQTCFVKMILLHFTYAKRQERHLDVYRTHFIAMHMRLSNTFIAMYMLPMPVMMKILSS